MKSCTTPCTETLAHFSLNVMGSSVGYAGARMMMACGGGWIGAGWTVGGVIAGRIDVIWWSGMRDWSRGCGGGGGTIDGRGAWMMMDGRGAGAQIIIG